MKFRGKLVDIGCIQHFTRVISTIGRLAKSCTLRLTTKKIYFILSECSINGGIGIWCELLQCNFFNEYNMEGVSKEDNEIYLELVPDNLTKCLRCSQNAKNIKIKLTKKSTPCLTFEVELPSLTGSSRIVIHDVPVDVIPRKLWADMAEPEMPDFDVSICMPPLKVLRNIVDRMKNLSNFVSLMANCSGDMKLKVETELVTVSAHFRDLGHPQWKDNSSQTNKNKEDSASFVEARVDIRKFAQFLCGQQVNPLQVICNIADGQMVHLFMLHEDVSLQYYMPSVST